MNNITKMFDDFVNKSQIRLFRTDETVIFVFLMKKFIKKVVTILFFLLQQAS